LSFARAADAPEICASILNGLSIATWSQGDYALARQYLEEGLEIRRRLGRKDRVAGMLTNLGNIAFSEGAYADARRFQEECIALQRELGDRFGLSAALNNLGVTVEAQGDYAAADRAYIESIALARECQLKQTLAYALNSRGHLMIAQGNSPEALTCYRESLAVFAELGEKRGLAYCFEGLAMIHAALRWDAPAVVLLASAGALRDQIGAPLDANEAGEIGRVLSAIRTRMAEPEFAGLWSRGQALTTEQARALASEDGNAAAGPEA
jgi:tetratricopeptide (TPR) repeat protein